MLALVKGWMLSSPLTLMDAGSCHGMDVVKSTDLMGGKEYKGHTKNKRVSLESPLALMDASSCQWDGCCEVP